MQRNEARSSKISLVMSDIQLFAVFFTEIRKKDGHEYEPECLAVMHCSLYRHLKKLWQKLQYFVRS